MKRENIRKHEKNNRKERMTKYKGRLDEGI